MDISFTATSILIEMMRELESAIDANYNIDPVIAEIERQLTSLINISTSTADVQAYTRLLGVINKTSIEFSGGRLQLNDESIRKLLSKIEIQEG